MVKRTRLSRSGSALREKRLAAVRNWVDIGYGGQGEGARSLSFKTEGLPPGDAAKIVRVVKSYNEFRGADVAKAVTKMQGHVSSVEFGREGSPVLYVQMPYWTHQIAGSKETSGTPFTATQEKQNADYVMALLRKTGPDELDYDQSTNVIRAWWD